MADEDVRCATMKNPRIPTASERLAQLKRSAGSVTYSENNPVGPTESLHASIHGVPATAEVFVEVTDGVTTRVRSFISRHKNCPPDLRREEIPLVDTADAFALARKMTRHWPQRPGLSPHDVPRLP